MIKVTKGNTAQKLCADTVSTKMVDYMGVTMTVRTLTLNVNEFWSLHPHSFVEINKSSPKIGSRKYHDTGPLKYNLFKTPIKIADDIYSYYQ